MSEGLPPHDRQVVEGANVSSRIRVNPGLLRQAGADVLAQTRGLEAEADRALDRIRTLDTSVWAGESRARINDHLLAVKPRANELIEMLTDLGTRLRRIADAFEAADRQGARDVSRIPWTSLQPEGSVAEPGQEPGVAGGMAALAGAALGGGVVGGGATARPPGGAAVGGESSGFVLPAGTSAVAGAAVGFAALGRTAFDRDLRALGGAANLVLGPGHVTQFSRWGRQFADATGLPLDLRTRNGRFLKAFTRDDVIPGYSALDLASAGLELFEPDESGQLQLKREIELNDIGRGMARAGFERVLSEAHPAVATVMLVNGVVQVGGAGLVSLSSAAVPYLAANERTADLLRASTSKLDRNVDQLDLSAIKDDVFDVVWSATGEPIFNAADDFYQTPSLDSGGRLLLATAPMLISPAGAVALNLALNERARGRVMEETSELLSHTVDFGAGVLDIGGTVSEHAALFGLALGERVVTSAPLPDDLRADLLAASQDSMAWVANLPPASETLGSVADGLGRFVFGG